MREPHSEGVANHADLASCAGDAAVEALTEALAGRLSSREILSSGRRPWKLPAREPEDLSDARREGQTGGRRRKRYAPPVRR